MNKRKVIRLLAENAANPDLHGLGLLHSRTGADLEVIGALLAGPAHLPGNRTVPRSGICWQHGHRLLSTSLHQRKALGQAKDNCLASHGAADVSRHRELTAWHKGAAH